MTALDFRLLGRLPRTLFALLCASLLIVGTPVGATRWDCKMTGARNQSRCCCKPSGCGMSSCASRKAAGAANEVGAHVEGSKKAAPFAATAACCEPRYDAADALTAVSRSDGGQDSFLEIPMHVGLGPSPASADGPALIDEEFRALAVPLHLLHRVFLC